MPHKITAQYRIVTPMFIGDARQQAGGISPNSVKGALRFWWRALNWGTCLTEANNNEVDALRILHEREAKLFGGLPENVNNEQSGKSEIKGGQGTFLLRVFHDALTSTSKEKVHPDFKKNDAARYLGYGLMVAFDCKDKETKEITKHGGQLERNCLNENQEFIVELVFRHNIDPSIQKALIALGLLGGLGSRSRHGMGSIALSSLKINGTEQWVIATNKESYHQQIQALFPVPVPPSTTRPPLPITEPPFSAFCESSRIDHLLSAKDCYTALNAFGKAMLMYRSWGRSSTVLGMPSERRFKDDHDWFRVHGWSKAHPYFHPERVEFGLPHNYHPTTHHVTPEIRGRRSSPLLFHIHPVDNQFIGISVYLPAQFLPAGEKIIANGKHIPNGVKWTIITDFLDGKEGNPPTPNNRFPTKKAVLP